MPRYSAAGTTDALITSLRGPSLYADGAAGARLRQAEVWNTSAVAFSVGLIRWTAAGTQGTAIVEDDWDQNMATHLCDAFNTHTANATAGNILMRGQIGAAIGSGIIWVFGESGIVIPEGTANGIGFYLPTGTAQNFDFNFIWDE